MQQNFIFEFMSRVNKPRNVDSFVNYQNFIKEPLNNPVINKYLAQFKTAFQNADDSSKAEIMRLFDLKLELGEISPSAYQACKAYLNSVDASPVPRELKAHLVEVVGCNRQISAKLQSTLSDPDLIELHDLCATQIRIQVGAFNDILTESPELVQQLNLKNMQDQLVAYLANSSNKEAQSLLSLSPALLFSIFQKERFPALKDYPQAETKEAFKALHEYLDALRKIDNRYGSELSFTKDQEEFFKAIQKIGTAQEHAKVQRVLSSIRDPHARPDSQYYLVYKPEDGKQSYFSAAGKPFSSYHSALKAANATTKVAEGTKAGILYLVEFPNTFKKDVADQTALANFLNGSSSKTQWPEFLRSVQQVKGLGEISAPVLKQPTQFNPNVDQSEILLVNAIKKVQVLKEDLEGAWFLKILDEIQSYFTGKPSLTQSKIDALQGLEKRLQNELSKDPEYRSSVTKILLDWQHPGGYAVPESPLDDDIESYTSDADEYFGSDLEAEFEYPNFAPIIGDTDSLIDKPRFSVFNVSETHTRQILNEIEEESKRGDLGRRP